MPVEFASAGHCPSGRWRSQPFSSAALVVFELPRTPPFAAITTTRAPGAMISTFSRTSDTTEYYRLHKITGDGRCMFRATVRSLAMNKGVFLGTQAELKESDQLRHACHDALCRTSQRSRDFPDARKQIMYGYGDLTQYCQQLAKANFWGGEVEMMVISAMLKVPIFVYTSNAEDPKSKNRGYKMMAQFGEKYASSRGGHTARRPVRLLYTGGNHFDLLV